MAKGSNVIKPQQGSAPTSNVITPQSFPNNTPSYGGNVIRPISSKLPASRDKVRLAPIEGGIGTVVTRQIAMKTLRHNNTLRIVEL